jgi:hypothetical protein
MRKKMLFPRADGTYLEVEGEVVHIDPETAKEMKKDLPTAFA